jgi:UDP-N-acetyl-2-amino-2-deoxyglucuronate dehydrogenase
MKTFALVGAAGYIAPRHMKAIRDIGGRLIAACDPHDAVGILDSYFPDCEFFTDELPFLEYLKNNPVDYLTVCTPNYRHYTHISMGLGIPANVICEKPPLLRPYLFKEVANLERICERKAYTILQLHLHPAVLELKRNEADYSKVKIRYVTPRGRWYHSSWKGFESASGGIMMNIGVHLFDIALWLYGKCLETEVKELNGTHASGRLRLERADVEWFLSIDRKHLSDDRKANRLIEVDGKHIADMTGGFEDLHTEVYKRIVDHDEFRISEAFEAVKMVHELKMQWKP